MLIIGILAAIAVPQYQKAVEKSRVSEALLLVKAISDAQDRYFLQTGQFAVDVDDLDIMLPAGLADSNQGAGRKLTANFDVGVSTAWKAVANRLPFATRYAIVITYDNQKFCAAYTDNYKTLCASIGGKSAAAVVIKCRLAALGIPAVVAGGAAAAAFKTYV